MFKKALGAFAAIALVVSVSIPAANALTTSELIDLLVSLGIIPADQAAAAQAAVGTTSSSSSTCALTTAPNMTVGSQGANVIALQDMLIESGDLVIPAGVSKGYFGSLTQSALASWQAKMGISPAVGYFGPITRSHITCVADGSDDSDDDSSDETSSDLEGGAGSVDTYTLVSGYSNEKVGEGEDDVEVAGLEIENSDGSDIEVTAVKLVFDEGTAGSDFKKYAEDVSIWFDGEKVGEADGDDFTDDNSWSQTITLDSGVVIDSNDTGEIIVAVSGLSNLDSNDEGDTWTVDFRSIRYRDAQGAVITEDPTTATETFSFESFATAAKTELKISNGDETINDAHIIGVHASESNEADDIPVFSFEMEVKGDSDISVDDFSVEATVTGAGHLDEMVDNLTLYMDGEEVDSMAPATDEETQLFDDLNLTLEAGETYEFEIRADFLPISGALDEGDTLRFTIGETETDLATTDIDDEEGNALADADITGSASSEASATYSSYIDVELVGTPTATVLSDGAGGNDDDITTFVMQFDITAHINSSTVTRVYVGDTAVSTTVADGSIVTPETDAIVYRVYDSGSAVTGALLADLVQFTTNSKAADSTDNIQLTDGGTTRVTLTVTNTGDGSATADGIYYMDLAAIGWGVDDDTTYEYQYTYDLDAFETSPVTAD